MRCPLANKISSSTQLKLLMDTMWWIRLRPDGESSTLQYSIKSNTTSMLRPCTNCGRGIKLYVCMVFHKLPKTRQSRCAHVECKSSTSLQYPERKSLYATCHAAVQACSYGQSLAASPQRRQLASVHAVHEGLMISPKRCQHCEGVVGHGKVVYCRNKSRK